MELCRATTAKVLRCLAFSVYCAVASVCAATAPTPLSRALEVAAGSNHGAWGDCESTIAGVKTWQTREAAVQYLSTLSNLIAWRIVTVDGGDCIALDWPEQRLLTPRQADGLLALLSEADRAGELDTSTKLQEADIEPQAVRDASPRWLPLRHAARGTDMPSLPWCPRTLAGPALIPVQLPERIAPLLLRVRPHRCRAGSRPLAGSGVLLSPDLALTAAHIVLTADGLVCDRYRVVPGGRRYTDPPASPYGMAYVSRAYLSERAGWHASAASAPLPDAQYAERTARDFAFLMLDEAIRLPANMRWPRLRFTSTATLPAGLRVMRAGYGVIGPRGRIAPGVSVNLLGQSACARGPEPFRRFAVWMSPGTSGGPIWRWPDPGSSFELLSLAVRLETHRDHQFETLGPHFDEIDYQRLLSLLRQR